VTGRLGRRRPDPGGPYEGSIVRTRRSAACIVVALLLASSPLHAQRTANRWVGTWATAVVAAPPQPVGQPNPLQVTLRFNNQTLRQIVRTSLGGNRARVVVTNAYGTRPLVIGGASVAVRDRGAAIVSGTARSLTFSGAMVATVPPGAVLISDPVDLAVPPLGDVVIDLYLPEDTGASPSPLTIHTASRQTSYVSSTGNHLGAAELPGASPMTSWAFLARLEVSAPEGAGAIVALGDSITDGFASTNDTNNRWPDHLARRLQAAGRRLAVLNLGIDGNRVLADGAGVNALARFDRDVAAQSGVTHVVVLEGINDLGIHALFKDGPPPTADQLIAGHRQLIARAHARGLGIVVSTLLPYEGTTFPGYFTPEGERSRQAFNQWVRTTKDHDGFIDLDAVIRDPANPTRMLPKYDSGDHLHPSDAGYEAMAQAVDLSLLREETTVGAAAR